MVLRPQFFLLYLEYIFLADKGEEHPDTLTINIDINDNINKGEEHPDNKH